MRTYWIETLLIAALFVIALNVSLAHAQTGDSDGDAVPDYVYGNNADSNMNIAITPRGSTITVQPLDAPTNPYRGQYNDFDRQLFNSIDRNFTQSQLNTLAQQAPGVRNRNLFNDPVAGSRRVPVMVDENGFMVPTTSPRYLTPQFVQTAPGEYTVADADLYDEDLGDYTDRDADINADDSNDVDVDAVGIDDSDAAAKVNPGSASNDKVAVKGLSGMNPGLAFTYTTELDEQQYRAFRAAQIEAAASVLPSIPTWVEALHPTEFALLPNGGAIITTVDPHDVTTVTVYSAEGRVLGTVPSMADAARFTAKNYDSIVAQASARGWDVVNHEGYIMLRDRESRKVQAVFDWDGTPVELSTELEPRPYYFTPLRWENVAPVAVQQRKVPAAGRKPQAQQTTGSNQPTDNNPSPDSDVNTGW